VFAVGALPSPSGDGDTAPAFFHSIQSGRGVAVVTRDFTVPALIGLAIQSSRRSVMVDLAQASGWGDDRERYGASPNLSAALGWS